MLAAYLAFLVNPVFAQDVVFENNGNVTNAIRGTIIVRDREVSAANTALTVTYDIGNINNVLDIEAVCSAGTATLTVSGSSDDQNFLTLDSITTASPQTKHYNNSTVGATLALTPLSYRWVKIAVGTCGASNTSTLTVSAK